MRGGKRRSLSVTIGDLVGYRSKKINVLVIKRGNNLINLPSFQEVIRAGDELVVVGDAEVLRAAGGEEIARRLAL